MVGRQMADQRDTRGALIARGNTSDVWSWSGSWVVKVLRPDIPRQWAAIEADITRRVHEAGLPVPGTDGTVEVDGRPAIILERIDGVSMWSQMKASPSRLRPLVEELVDLQVEIQAAGPIEGIPDLAERLHGKIEEADELPGTERRLARNLLAAMPVGSALCHGDMHPANILESRRGWLVVDWFDAAIGYPTADLARSSLLMRPPTTPQASNKHLDGATRDLLERLHATYLEVLTERDLVDGSAFATWEAILAVARMSEPVNTADLIVLWEQWRSGGWVPLA